MRQEQVLRSLELMARSDDELERTQLVERAKPVERLRQVRRTMDDQRLERRFQMNGVHECRWQRFDAGHVFEVHLKLLEVRKPRQERGERIQEASTFGAIVGRSRN